MTITRIESKHGRRWFWSGDRIRFITLNGRWRRMSYLATKFNPERLPA